MKFNKIFSTIAAGAMILGLGACTDEVRYEPTLSESGDEVYFAENGTTEFQMLPDATSVDAKIYRVKDSDDLEVSLSYTAKDADGLTVNGLFSVPQKVVFPKGSKEIVVPINYAFSDITPNVDYSVTITIDGAATTPYGLVEQTFTLSYSPWSDWERVSSDPAICYMGSPINQIVGNYPQYLYTRRSLIDDNLVQYKVPDPFSDVDFQFVFEIDKSQFITNEDGEKCYIVRAPAVDTGIHNGDTDEIFGLMDVYSWYMWAWDYTKTPEEAYKWMAAKGFGESTFNTATGLLSVDYMLYPINKDKGSAYANTFYYFQFPGYADYSFAFDYVGSFVTVNGSESAVISVLKGADVSSFTATCLPGALTDEEVEKAAQDLVASGNYETYSTNPTELRLPMEENGVYTLVVAGFDEMMNVITTDSYTFEFTTVQKESEWEKFGEAEYTDLFAGPSYGEAPFYWTVPVEQHKTTKGFYRLVNPYSAPDSPWKKYTLGGNGYVYIHAENPDAAWIELSPLNVALGMEGAIYGWSLAGLAVEGYGWTLEQAFEKGFTGWLEDGSLYFPPETLLVVFESEPNNPYNAGGKDYTDWSEPVVTFFNLLEGEAKAPAAKKAPRKVNFFDFHRTVKETDYKVTMPKKNKVEVYKRDKNFKSQNFIR